MFKAFKIDFFYSMTWHSQMNGMFERSNQIVEIAFRYYIAFLNDVKHWPKIFSRISAILNNSTNYSNTSLAPIQILYNFRTKETLDLFRIEDLDDAEHLKTNSISVDTIVTIYPIIRNVIRQKVLIVNQEIPGIIPEVLVAVSKNFVKTARLVFMTEYKPSHIDVKDVIAFASLRMKEYYDARYQPKFFRVGDLVNLQFHKDYRVSVIKSKKLGPQLIEPFFVLKRIERLVYRLKLSFIMRIHNVISIIHLESITNPAENLYRRRHSFMFIEIIDNENEYEIEKLF